MNTLRPLLTLAALALACLPFAADAQTVEHADTSRSTPSCLVSSTAKPLTLYVVRAWLWLQDTDTTGRFVDTGSLANPGMVGLTMAAKVRLDSFAVSAPAKSMVEVAWASSLTATTCLTWHSMDSSKVYVTPHTGLLTHAFVTTYSAWSMKQLPVRAFRGAKR